MSCYGCACNHCLYNAEAESWYFTPGEIQDVEDICYCCDECKHYDGDFSKRSQWRQECRKKRLPEKYIQMQREAEERAARKRQKDFHVIVGGKSSRGTDSN